MQHRRQLFEGKAQPPAVPVKSEPEPAKIKIPVSAPPAKYQPTHDKYQKAMAAEWGRLKAAGYSRDQIMEAMQGRGWK